MWKNQPFDMEARRLKPKKFAVENYTTSLMSNAKWRALFNALDESGVDVKGMAVKFIGDDREFSPVYPSLYPPYAFVDLWPLNVYPLVEIEWVEFRRIVKHERPNNVPAKLVPQDIDAIRLVIENTGKHFPLEVSDEAIRVVGHLR